MKNGKRILAFIILLLFLIACSFTSSDSQSQPNSGVESNETIEQATQESSQPVIEETPENTVDGNEISAVQYKIYEYKEGWTSSSESQILSGGDGWKPYHIKYAIVANKTTSDQYILDLSSLDISGLNSRGSADHPYIVTTDGLTYGNNPDTAYTIALSSLGERIYLFFGIPISSFLTRNGNLFILDGNFSIPEKLTPQKLVIPMFNYTADLPSLGTEQPPEITIETDQIVDFPANVALDSVVNVKVSNFIESDSHITIDYEIINNDITKNQSGFYYAALVDSYGFMSRQIADLMYPHSECEDEFIAYDDVHLGPGQTKTGTLCFKKNTIYEPSFYVLYFAKEFVDPHTSGGGGIIFAGPDNKAILINP